WARKTACRRAAKRVAGIVGRAEETIGSAPRSGVRDPAPRRRARTARKRRRDQPAIGDGFRDVVANEVRRLNATVVADRGGDAGIVILALQDPFTVVVRS